MYSIGITIERILKVVPALEPKLTMIKSKWERYPKRTTTYWKELANTLNSDVVNKSEQEKIKNILMSKPPHVKPLYTFEEATSNDKIIGVLPENFADRIKHHDLLSVRMAMLQTKASLTRDRDLIVQLTKKSARIEISMKKLWVGLKDHFNLWDKDIRVVIKKQGSLLVLVDSQAPHAPTATGDNFMIRTDPETLKGFFRMLGLDPPADLF